MPGDRTLLQRLYNGPVAARQRLAEELYQEHGRAILADQGLRADIEQLQEFANLLNRHMAGIGMDAICSRCAAGPGGGCCSLYMAGETDSIQMLINMLAGVTVHPLNNNAIDCSYLGENGCLFKFKPMFCLNYNCEKILAAVPSAMARKLERFTGQVLAKQYEVEQKLLRFIRIGIHETKPGCPLPDNSVQGVP